MRGIATLWFLVISLSAQTQTVTNLQGFYRDGQVFLTWKEIADHSALYKVYRSATAITSSGQLSSCEYLGYVNSHSSVNHNLSYAEGTTRYLKIEPGGSNLSASTGLFVALTLTNGSYYYAVTTLVGNTENTTIIPGSNALTAPLAETVAMPKPVFQKTKKMGAIHADIYTVFVSTYNASGIPPMLHAGFVAFDFAVYLNNATSNRPLRIFFHGGGAHYLENIGVVDQDEVRLNVEHLYPDTAIGSEWWGAHQHFDIYNNANNSAPPTTGMNFNHGQYYLQIVIDWAVKHLPIDSNRIYLHATSVGSTPAFLYALTYPDRIAAVKLSSGSFNLSFLNDWQASCALNDGKKKRKDLDKKLGTVATNLPCNLNIGTYQALNGGWLINQYPTRNYPFIYSVNGKQDNQTGWTEKTIFYDSVNANFFGGWLFWDNRTHDGSGKTWVDKNFDLYRFRRNESFPAVTDCSLNEFWGNGNGNDGATYGTVNGTVDWVVSETLTSWQVKLFVRNLSAMNNTTIVYPDSCTATITPRRLQQLQLIPGQAYQWEVKHKGIVKQSGTIVYNGQLLTLPGIKIYRDTSLLTIQASTATPWYQDADNDGYGNGQVVVYASIQPNGYVAVAGDCNDNNAAVHPGTTEKCGNSIDDNCNGQIDENMVTASITPSGTVNECKGVAITLEAPVGSGYSYQWFKGGSPVSGATQSTYTVPKNQSGNYKVTITDAGGCSATSATTTINRYEKPEATITPLGNLDICLTGSVLLQANAGVGYSYQWLKGGNAITGATQQTYTATKKGNYKVVVTNAHGCTQTSDATKVTNSCRQALQQTGSVMLVPNPASELTYLWREGCTCTTLTIDILDMAGQIRIQFPTSYSMKEDPIVLPVDFLSPGWYLVRVRCGQKVFHLPLCIVRN